MGGLREEEKWKLDRTGTPEGWLRGGEGFPHLEGHSGAQSRGLGPAFPLSNRPGKSAWLSDRVLCPQRSPPGLAGPGDVGGRPGRSGEAGRRGPPEWEEQKSLLKPRKAAGLPDGVPRSLRTGLGVFCSAEPKLHPHTHHPRPFPVLWVLSIGPNHHPNLTPA